MLINIFIGVSILKEFFKEIFRPANSIRFSKVLRISIASCLAIIIGGLLGLKYSATAGVIAFLSTQDTLRETHFDVIIRCLSYALGVLLSFAIFSIFGYTPYAFGLFMLILVTICYYLGWASVISTSVVVCTHFLMEGHFGSELILNEFLLLIVGTGCTMLLNRLVSNNTTDILNDIQHIEAEMRLTFMEMSKYALLVDNSMLDIDELEHLHKHLSESQNRAIINRKNTYWDDSHYYIAYMNTRISQYQAMQRIVENMHKMTSPSFMAQDLSLIFTELGNRVHQRRNIDTQLERILLLEEKFDSYPVPSSRTELHDISYTHDIINELKYYIQLKIEFVDSLSAKQLQRYWSENDASPMN